jgi:CubicO group peptidase (beta-lactamase class C family)
MIVKVVKFMLIRAGILTAILAMAVLPLRPGRAARVATGLVSHTLCSQVFAAHLDPDRVFAESLRSRPGIALIHWALRYRVDSERREVRVTLAGLFASRAVYHEGVGCILVHGSKTEAPVLPPNNHEDNSTPRVSTESADPVEPADQRLRAALDHAFAEPDGHPYRRTQAVVVVREGRIVAERYASGYGVNTPLLGYSATKSVISALVGILVRQHRLRVDQKAPVPMWHKPGDPRDAIIIDQLLRMTSGLALDEGSSPASPVARMMYLENDMAGFAVRARLEATPGTKWNYTSGNYILLSKIIRDAAGGTAKDVLEFAENELFSPLGMRHVTLEFDATGTPVGSTYMLAPAREWASFGVLYLNDGIVNGHRILPEGWVQYSASPTLGRGYGAGFWTNSGPGKDAAERVRWGMPPDSFFAYGILGQYVVIVPSEQLVIVRFGATQRWTEFDTPGVARLVAEVIAAYKHPGEGGPSHCPRPGTQSADR